MGYSTCRTGAPRPGSKEQALELTAADPAYILADSRGLKAEAPVVVGLLGLGPGPPSSGPSGDICARIRGGQQRRSH